MTGAENKPFENRQIPADELPSYRWIDFQPVAARYLFWALMTGPGAWLLVAIGLLVVVETGLVPVDGFGWLPLVPFLIALFSVAMTWLTQTTAAGPCASTTWCTAPASSGKRRSSCLLCAFSMSRLCMARLSASWA